MSEFGKTHIVIMWTVGPDDVASGDRLLASHGKWMTAHPREGETALRSYSISKGPELSNPLDPSSSPTGHTLFVLEESFESPAGVADTGSKPRRPGRTSAGFWSGAPGAGFIRSTAEPSSRPSGRRTTSHRTHAHGGQAHGAVDLGDAVQRRAAPVEGGSSGVLRASTSSASGAIAPRAQWIA